MPMGGHTETFDALVVEPQDLVALINQQWQQATITPGLPKDIVAQARKGALAGRGLHRTSRMP
jgi:hypothetical protein